MHVVTDVPSGASQAAMCDIGSQRVRRDIDVARAACGTKDSTRAAAQALH